MDARPGSAARARTLWALFALQAVCASFFLGDALADALAMAGLPALDFATDSDAVEALVVVGLVVSLGFTGFELRRLLTRHRRVEDQLRAASGAFAELLDEHFERWALTPSERDVAILAIKGLTLGEIAEIRRTALGTVKAQTAAIYRKAGVGGRPQLLSLFIEELMGDGVTAPA